MWEVRWGSKWTRKKENTQRGNRKKREKKIKQANKEKQIEGSTKMRKELEKKKGNRTHEIQNCLDNLNQILFFPYQDKSLLFCSYLRYFALNIHTGIILCLFGFLVWNKSGTALVEHELQIFFCPLLVFYNFLKMRALFHSGLKKKLIYFLR